MPKKSQKPFNQFEERALSLFFSGNLSALATHLHAIDIDPAHSPSPRILLLTALLQPDSKIPLEDVFAMLLIENDMEACCACVGGALMNIWAQGNDFSLYIPWLEKAEHLLQAENLVPPMAEAYLLLQVGLAKIVGPGQLSTSLEDFKRQRVAAERAGSVFLQVMGAAMHSYCYTWNGNLPEGERILLDAAPLLSDPHLNPLALQQHQNALALNNIIQGHPERGIEILQPVLKHPLFSDLPVTLQIQTFNIALDGFIVYGDLKKAEKIADHIRALAVPEQNNYFRCYYNFCLGMSALLAGRPSKASAYMEESSNRATACHSTTAMRMNALLHGQILADLGKETEALNHLEAWHPIWRESEYYLIAALGRLETAALYYQQGKIEKARTCWNQAHELLPRGEKMYHLYRPADFYPRLKENLFSPEPCEIKECTHVVRIKTLGSFELEINGQKIFDHNWRGRQSKVLLKLIIASGGHKISAEKISAQLWPDADGDKAINALNVTLSRLRKTGCKNGQPSPLWLVSKHKKLSLAGNFCCTDALIFRNTIRKALKCKDNVESLSRALESYTGNFLPQDSHPAEINNFRNELLSLYVEGILQLSHRLRSDDNVTDALSWLEKATLHDPLNEQLYAEQIKLHLQQKNKNKAHKLYHHACSMITAHHNEEPGSTLQSLAKHFNH